MKCGQNIKALVLLFCQKLLTVINSYSAEKICQFMWIRGVNQHGAKGGD